MQFHLSEALHHEEGCAHAEKDIFSAAAAACLGSSPAGAHAALSVHAIYTVRLLCFGSMGISSPLCREQTEAKKVKCHA